MDLFASPRSTLHIALQSHLVNIPPLFPIMFLKHKKCSMRNKHWLVSWDPSDSKTRQQSSEISSNPILNSQSIKEYRALWSTPKIILHVNHSNGPITVLGSRHHNIKVVLEEAPFHLFMSALHETFVEKTMYWYSYRSWCGWRYNRLWCERWWYYEYCCFVNDHVTVGDQYNISDMLFDPLFCSDDRILHSNFVPSATQTDYSPAMGHYKSFTCDNREAYWSSGSEYYYAILAEPEYGSQTNVYENRSIETSYSIS